MRALLVCVLAVLSTACPANRGLHEDARAPGPLVPIATLTPVGRSYDEGFLLTAGARPLLPDAFLGWWARIERRAGERWITDASVSHCATVEPKSDRVSPSSSLVVTTLPATESSVLRPGSYRFVVDFRADDEPWTVAAPFDVDPVLDASESQRVLALLDDPDVRGCLSPGELAMVAARFTALADDAFVARLLDLPLQTYEDAHALAAPVVSVEALSLRALDVHGLRTGDAGLGLAVAIWERAPCIEEPTPCAVIAARFARDLERGSPRREELQALLVRRFAWPSELSRNMLAAFERSHDGDAAAKMARLLAGAYPDNLAVAPAAVVESMRARARIFDDAARARIEGLAQELAAAARLEPAEPQQSAQLGEATVTTLGVAGVAPSAACREREASLLSLLDRQPTSARVRFGASIPPTRRSRSHQ